MCLLRSHKYLHSQDRYARASIPCSLDIETLQTALCHFERSREIYLCIHIRSNHIDTFDYATKVAPLSMTGL